MPDLRTRAVLVCGDPEVAWYATLARCPARPGLRFRVLRTALAAEDQAAALFTNPARRILLVKPNHRDHWSLPSGLLEHGEPPGNPPQGRLPQLGMDGHA